MTRFLVNYRHRETNEIHSVAVQLDIPEAVRMYLIVFDEAKVKADERLKEIFQSAYIEGLDWEETLVDFEDEDE